MRSIRNRFVVMVLTGIFTCAIIIGYVTWSNIEQLEAASSSQILNLMCRQETMQINQKIASIENSVDILAALSIDELDEPEKIDDEAYRTSYLKNLDRITRHVVDFTDGVVSYYFRFKPEVGDDRSGFFYRLEDDIFVPEDITPLAAYEPDDVEHVGWYYKPVSAGHPIWMEPYYNKNIDIYMTSYVVPLYKEEELIGIVGMDIDFSLIDDQVREIKAFDTGYAFLLSSEGDLYSHPLLDGNGSEPEPARSLDQYKTFIQENEASDDLITYPYLGENKMLAFSTLRNGMKLLLTVPEKEIFARRDQQIRQILLIFSCAGLVFAVIAFMAAKRITDPLARLTAAAREIADGNLDVELPEAKNDEVGDLTRTLGMTTKALKKQIADINIKAYRDPLTGVRNRAACSMMMDELTRKMAEGDRSFGIVVMDVNNLKTINDVYGHVRGDDYLKASCAFICRVFRHSPVFRIGGDEFVAVLDVNELKHQEIIMHRFEEEMDKTVANENPWERLSIARGFAACRPEDLSADAVFERADSAMYENKKKMKGEI